MLARLANLLLGSAQAWLIVEPLTRLIACVNEKLVVRSHSQALVRLGRPKRPSTSIPSTTPSGASTARVPTGIPLICGRYPLAIAIASTSCSADNLRGRAWEKLVLSSSFHCVDATES